MCHRRLPIVVLVLFTGLAVSALLGGTDDRSPGYGSSPADENLLVFAYYSTYYIPHMADGKAGNLYFGTEFTINNVQDEATSVRMRFFADSGTPWPLDLRTFDVTLGASPYTTVSFLLQPHATAHFYTGAIDPLTVGWGIVDSTLPIAVSANFHLLQGPAPLKVLWEAGVLPVPANTQFSFDANVSQGDHIGGINVDMGYAIGNPSDSLATVTVTLFPLAGGAAISTKTRTVPAGGHISQFLSELFNDVVWGTRFHGLVRFSSNVNVAIVALKHSSGNGCDVYSSLAVQPDSEFKRQIVYDREDNSTIAKAQPIASPSEIFGTANSPTDGAEDDYYSIYLYSGQTLSVFMVAEMAGSTLNNVMTIYDPSSTQVAYVDDFASPLHDGFIQYTATTTGTHYIKTTSIGGTWARTSFYRMFVLVK